ncbi:hypothetical protein LJ737_02620 [Hymenobacter sp. 15J16-1T3B]|uniref:hypothetical protein n=1 Tax=Hymenobacter sp. 15J16-1T3B TaxID=2886941 RepID=UPI001D0FE974|nr:hypothetical protein [Hymenobacter sp. 15J16-1T3B]MCC3156110.1 hypothetical protein [Hymenobacter sp. 15J16-1T3B]
MSTEVGTYSVEEAFQLAGRGWALVGELTGQVSSGNCLAFSTGLVLPIIGVNFINTRSQSEKFGLLIPLQFTSRQELLDQQIIGATARVLE